MRPTLSDLLTHRYPGLYGSPSCHPSELASGGGGFPFEHRDGWFGIVDALSEVLVWRAGIEGRPVPRAQQVKEKFGTLRFYFGDREADNGAIDMAEEMTARLCEVSGRPGRLGNRGGWWATRAPGMDKLQFARTGVGEDGRMGVPLLGCTVDEVRRWRADVLAPAERGGAAGVLEVPVGWLDLVDGLLRRLSDRQGVVRARPAGVITLSPHRADHGDAVPVRVGRVDVSSTGALRVDHVGGGAYAEGIVAMAVALSRRVDAESGAVGPVGDDGVLLGAS